MMRKLVYPTMASSVVCLAACAAPHATTRELVPASAVQTSAEPMQNESLRAATAEECAVIVATVRAIPIRGDLIGRIEQIDQLPEAPPARVTCDYSAYGLTVRLARPGTAEQGSIVGVSVPAFDGPDRARLIIDHGPGMGARRWLITMVRENDAWREEDVTQRRTLRMS